MSARYNMGRSASARKSDRLLCPKRVSTIRPGSQICLQPYQCAMARGTQQAGLPARPGGRGPAAAADPNEFPGERGTQAAPFLYFLEYAGNAGQICNRADLRRSRFSRY